MIAGPRSFSLGVVACVAVTGCGGPAEISNRWSVAAGPQGAAFVERGRPTEGAPLVRTASAKTECMQDTRLLAVLGEVCDHESENRPPPVPVGDLDPGIPPPTPEVRWYCSGRIAVRVVFERCDAMGMGNLDGIRPLEIAVATRR